MVGHAEQKRPSPNWGVTSRINLAKEEGPPPQEPTSLRNAATGSDHAHCDFKASAANPRFTPGYLRNRCFNASYASPMLHALDTLLAQAPPLDIAE